jgi:hypothetical protein
MRAVLSSVLPRTAAAGARQAPHKTARTLLARPSSTASRALRLLQRPVGVHTSRRCCRGRPQEAALLPLLPGRARRVCCGVHGAS